MKKDELLEFINEVSFPYNEWEQAEEIRSIINLHFSISEEEREEAIDALNKQKPDVKSEYFAHSFIVFKSDDKTIKTILKALGGTE